MMTRLALLLLLSISVAGCDTWYRIMYAYPETAPPPPVPLRGREPVDVRSVLGCWRITRADWENPWVFALDPLPATTRFVTAEQGARRARSFSPGDRVADVFWRVTPRNAIELVVDDGLHGAIAEFVVRDGRLAGRLTTLTDVVDVYPPIQRVAAERTPCPADGADPAARR